MPGESANDPILPKQMSLCGNDNNIDERECGVKTNYKLIEKEVVMGS